MIITYVGMQLRKSDFLVEYAYDPVCDVTAEVDRDMLGHYEINIIGINDPMKGEVGALLKSEAQERIKPDLRSFYISSRMAGKEAATA